VSEQAYVAGSQQVSVTDLGGGVLQLRICHGFMQQPDVVAAVGSVEIDGEPVDAHAVTYFLGDELVIAGDVEGMHPWREHLFVVLDRTADSAARFFDLPTECVVTVGTHVEI
jgi:KUP system potassium uptake protein